jgi:hypothetical protein
MTMLRQYFIITSLYWGALAADKNLVDDEHSTSGEIYHDYDSHGDDKQYFNQR